MLPPMPATPPPPLAKRHRDKYLRLYSPHQLVARFRTRRRFKKVHAGEGVAQSFAEKKFPRHVMTYLRMKSTKKSTYEWKRCKVLLWKINILSYPKEANTFFGFVLNFALSVKHMYICIVIDRPFCWHSNHQLPCIVCQPRKTNLCFLFSFATNQ